MTPCTLAHQSPRIIEFSRQEYWNDLPFPSPGDPPDAGNDPRSPGSLPSEPPGTLQCMLLGMANKGKKKKKKGTRGIYFHKGEFISIKLSKKECFNKLKKKSLSFCGIVLWKL